MREHKYRVWYRGRMIYKSLNDILVDPTDNFMFLDGEVMDFIGRRDRNGTEIYNNDIVKADWCWTEPHLIEWPHDEYDFIEYVLDDEVVEVIGNLYETPDLMRGTDSEEQTQ